MTILDAICWISGTLKRYIDELSVTGLTSNPTIFDEAIKNSTSYDGSIRDKLAKGKSGETLFFELALEDLIIAAGAKSFVKSWNDLMAVIASKSASLTNRQGAA